MDPASSYILTSDIFVKPLVKFGSQWDLVPLAVHHRNNPNCSQHLCLVNPSALELDIYVVVNHLCKM